MTPTPSTGILLVWSFPAVLVSPPPKPKAGRVLQAGKRFYDQDRLTLITIMGVALATVAVIWTTQVRRSQESELEYRLGKMRHGIKKYKVLYKEVAPSLEAVAEKKLVRFNCLIDPITGKQWQIRYDGQGKIKNVYCGSEKESFRLIGGKKILYSEW